MVGLVEREETYTTFRISESAVKRQPSGAKTRRQNRFVLSRVRVTQQVRWRLGEANETSEFACVAISGAETYTCF